jgi:LEA14-like dessication related protein
MKAIVQVKITLLVLLLSVLGGCASLTPQFNDPQVSLIEIRPLPAVGLEQRFSISLRVSNPNDRLLSLSGMSYHLRVEGFNLVSGVATELPEVAAYGEAVYQLEAGTNLLNGLRFIEQMLNSPKDSLSYSLEARMGFAEWLLPDKTLVYKGEFSFKR